jgi:hypothetical protein
MMQTYSPEIEQAMKKIMPRSPKKIGVDTLRSRL